MNKSHSLRQQRDPAAVHTSPLSQVPPFLLDRLTSEQPQRAAGSAEAFAPPRSLLRESLLRDLNWLLNCTNLEATHDLAAYPHVRRSVVNFGLGTLAGVSVSALDRVEIESAIREAIVHFEPRMLAESVEVRCVPEPSTPSPRGKLSLEISAQLRSGEAQQTFHFDSEIDLESGHITLRSHGNG